MNFILHPVRTLVALFSFFIFGGALSAQQGDTLLGCQTSGGGLYKLSWMDIPTENISVSLGGSVNGAQQGQSSYDRVNHRYFVKGAGIAVVDAITGNPISVISDVLGMNNFEYDEGCNCLVGPDTQGGANFTRVDIATGVKTVVAPIQVAGLVWSESTFDRINRNYFFRSMNGVQKIDSMGVVSGAMGLLSGIEFDATLDAIFGTYVNGQTRIFARIDVSSAQITTLSILPAATYYGGENTYDEKNHRYFAKTTMGIIMVDALTGNLIKTMQGWNSLFAIEYGNYDETPAPPVDPVGIAIRDGNTLSKINAFPNPAKDQLNFDNLPLHSSLEIVNTQGVIVYKTVADSPFITVNLKDLARGMYCYRISNAGASATGKIVLE